VAAQESSVKAKRVLAEASVDLQAGRYDLAVMKAQSAASMAEKSGEIQQQAARVVYLSGKAAESVPLFDRANELIPTIAPHNWERGIALGTCGKWAEGAQQFKLHHDVNPNDVENSAWYFLCVAKSEGLEAAKKSVIPSGGDGRQPMMTVLQMLKGTKTPKEVIEAAIANTSEGSGRADALFYADLYVGLYYDSLGDAENAKKYLLSSLKHGVKGYMVDTARVYLDARFPNPSIQNNQNAK
jgi:lipoprotein NlpI